MSTELFTDIPESKPSRLLAARIRADKAQERHDALRDARENYDAQPAETKWEIGEASHQLQEALDELEKAEKEAL